MKRPLAEQLELLCAAQAAVEAHFSFPGESTDFIHHAAPAILRLVSAMGYVPGYMGYMQTSLTVMPIMPISPTLKAVHAALLRVALPERVGDTDEAVYKAMGVPAKTFQRWKRRLGALRAAAAPGEGAPGEGAPGEGAPGEGAPADDAQLGSEGPGGQNGQVPTAAAMPAATMRAASTTAGMPGGRRPAGGGAGCTAQAITTATATTKAS